MKIRADRGSATLLLIGGVVAATLAVACVGSALVFSAQNHLQESADFLAISGADALSGRIAAYPCKLVQQMASEQSVTVEKCWASELDLRVIIGQKIGSFSLTARAHAGPLETVANLTSR